ncbi:hypothetical protein DY245_42365 [Streptomyces inhibens]|uniref:Tc1-like transposase DDE domain-containing protein n=1 Tax=Streptomyces inhibens TaxID=2293571 RepID=A0A371PQ40_STRIH|nr:hypothetical protein DY245_42365 [Streptomyces inhibens]
MRDLYFLDESGFAPTMPTGYTWSRAGQRAVVPCEDKKGRRVHVLGALAVGQHADLVRERTCGKIDAALLLEFVCTRPARLPGGAAALDKPPTGFTRVRPCTVVLDNASAHVARVFKGRREELATIGVELFCLPPRSPELNDIERVWRTAKYEDYPRARPHHRRSGRHHSRPSPQPSTRTHQRINSKLHQSRSALAPEPSRRRRPPRRTQPRTW